MSRPKVIYVMGAGRSGSTILGVTLGNCSGVFFAGELDRWFARSGVPRRAEPELRRFWDQILPLVEDAQALFDSRTGWIERSSAALDPRKLATRRRLRRRYRLGSERLYRAIASVTGATHIVDTSHYPLRARALQALPGVELYLLFLVRDPQRVVASLGRDDVVERRFDVPTSNAYLWLTHLLATRVFLRHPRERRMFVRHEEFLADPDGVIRQLLDWAGSSAPPPPLGSLSVGVPFHGNRLIDAELVELQPPPRTPEPRSRITALLQLPWRAVFSTLAPAARAGGRSPLRCTAAPR